MRKASGHCAHVPEFERLNYFYGQVLGHPELAQEQAFFREKMRLHNRCLHGWGVVCGLEVTPLPPEEPCPPDPCHPTPEPATMEIGCGFALDCRGDEIVVRSPIRFDPWCLLDADDRHEVEACGATTLWVSVCFKERLVDPVRPALPDACGTIESRYGRIRDGAVVKVTARRPHHEDRCDTCCAACEEGCCVELARIENFHHGKPVQPEDVHPEVRRLLETAAYPFSVIVSANWVHGYTYTQDEAHALLRGGLEVHFSKPVRTATVERGVCDFWVVEGGDGRSAQIYNLEGVLEVDHAHEYTHRLVYRQRSKETLQDGDRLIFTIRSAFLLDHCCRPVDGEHVGGRVPYLGEHTPEIDAWLAKRPCAHPHGRPVWTSGNGAGGGTFESWFYIKENARDDDNDDDDDDEQEGTGKGTKTAAAQMSSRRAGGDR
jgi:hypothetical protein